MNLKQKIRTKFKESKDNGPLLAAVGGMIAAAGLGYALHQAMFKRRLNHEDVIFCEDYLQHMRAGGIVEFRIQNGESQHRLTMPGE